jgi:hypothetical protein
MNFACLDLEIDAPENFCLLHGGVEAFDLKQSDGHGVWSKPILMKRMVSADPLRPRLQR